eukprot:3198039-Ditylum_brightwellii.AAC.1
MDRVQRLGQICSQGIEPVTVYMSDSIEVVLTHPLASTIMVRGEQRPFTCSSSSDKKACMPQMDATTLFGG